MLKLSQISLLMQQSCVKITAIKLHYAAIWYRSCDKVLYFTKEFVPSMPAFFKQFTPSVLAWPAWLRLLAVLPALLLLWLAVLWASLEAVPW
jgi:hypothetical protein